MENKIKWFKGHSRLYHSSDYNYILVKTMFYEVGKRCQKWEFKKFIGRNEKNVRQYETLETATYLDDIRKLANEYINKQKKEED